jgi:hypothetical protein
MSKMAKHTEYLSYYGFEQRLKELWLEYSWRLIKFEYIPLEYRFNYEIQESTKVYVSLDISDEIKSYWKSQT